MKNVITQLLHLRNLTELSQQSMGCVSCHCSLYFWRTKWKLNQLLWRKRLQLPMDVPLQNCQKCPLDPVRDCLVPWLNSECIVDTYLGTCVLGWEQANVSILPRRKWEQLVLELLKQKSLNPGEPLRSQSRSRLMNELILTYLPHLSSSLTLFHQCLWHRRSKCPSLPSEVFEGHFRPSGDRML